jgi:enoyl-CoA hydratase
LAFQYFDTRIENRVGWLVQNYPPVNAFGWDMLQKMEQGFIKMIEDPEVQVMVFASTLDKFFCVGGDLNAFVDIGEEGMERWVTICHRMVRLLRASPKPLMAAINGVAVGGRLEVTWHFDFRFAAAAARLGQPEIAISFLPPVGTTLALAHLLGRSGVLRFCMTRRSIRRKAPRKWGWWMRFSRRTSFMPRSRNMPRN